MKIGITYDLRVDVPTSADLPDDFQEEFDSPLTIDSISRALRGLGHEVEALGDGRELLERLLRDPPDFVFNLAEGHGIGRCREARVPAVLEMLGIPYTGSDPLTLSVTLDKDCAKRLAQSAGITVPRWTTLEPDDDLSVLPPLPYTAIVKPAWEGSSKGIRGKCVVDRVEELVEAVSALRRDHRQPILVEEYISGEELTVGIVGNERPRIIGILRVTPIRPDERFVYSLEVKRDYLRQVRYECVPAEQLDGVAEAALRVYRALGCRDVSRVDFRLHNGTPYFLEVNPLPGLNPESSDLVILSRLAGWSYEQLIESILQAATARYPLSAEDSGQRTADSGPLQPR
jgi:D-alanine-D-alanine ligase